MTGGIRRKRYGNCTDKISELYIRRTSLSSSPPSWADSGRLICDQHCCCGSCSGCKLVYRPADACRCTSSSNHGQFWFRRERPHPTIPRESLYGNGVDMEQIFILVAAAKLDPSGGKMKVVPVYLERGAKVGERAGNTDRRGQSLPICTISPGGILVMRRTRRQERKTPGKQPRQTTRTAKRRDT